ncbi:MAG: hypothetical protein QXG39_09065, partial [Candidatus Aenigmatarchaeota archaeon]
MVKRKVMWEFYVFSAAITALILFIGIYFGISLSRGKIEELQSELTKLKLRQEDLMFEISLLNLNKNVSCNLLGKAIQSVMEEAGRLGERVSLYETSEKIKYEEFESLKKEYTLTLVRYWFYVEEMKRSCNRSDLVTVLFFYSNKDCRDCSIQGTILTYWKQK